MFANYPSNPRVYLPGTKNANSLLNRMKINMFSSTVVLAFSMTLSVAAGEFDWPQWKGPDRTGVSKETGLLKKWPKGGAGLAWKIQSIGTGYSAPSIAKGRIYGMSNRGAEEVVWALSESNGKEIWAQPLGATTTGGMRQGIEGTGCSPTVDGDRLFVLGAGGDLVCLQTSDGKVVWRRNLIKDFQGQLPTWRFNESPLIDGDLVICTPGGVETTMVALKKTTGDLVWKTGIPVAGLGPVTRTAPANPTPAPSPPSREGQPSPENQEAGPKPPALIASGAKWRYMDKGARPDGAWTGIEFKDDAWAEGAAQLGYGDDDEKTKISNAPNSYPTYYFRRTFEVKDPGKLKPQVLRLLRDDGAAVYLNGKEIARSNLPDGPLEHGTVAESATPSERGYYVFDFDPSKLVAGKNVIAVEVHQSSAQSSDVSFDLELREKISTDVVGAPRPDRRRRFGNRGGGRGFTRSEAGYASAIAIDFGGQRQFVQLTAKTLIGVSAKDGKLLWRYDRPANNRGINCSTPIFHDGHVFAASAYGNGGGLARLSKSEDGKIAAEEVWFSKSMENHHGGMLVHDGCVYGANGGNGGGYLVCIDMKTGDVLWNERDSDKRRAEKGSMAFADGRIYYRTEDGDVLLIEPNRKEYIEHGRFEQPDRTRQPAWTHPVVANGKLYIRDQDTLYSYNVKAPAK